MKDKRLKDIEVYFTPDEAEDNTLAYEVCYKGKAGMKLFADRQTLGPTTAIAYPDLNDGYMVFPWAYVVYYNKDKVYYAPRWFVKGEFLLVLDRKTREYQYIKLKQSEHLLDAEENQEPKEFLLSNSDGYDYINSPQFEKIYSYQETLFLVPLTYPGIIKLSTVTGELEYYTDFMGELLGEIQKRGGFTQPAFGNSVRIKDTVYLNCRDCNRVLAFDMETCESRWIVLGEREYGNLFLLKERETLHLFSGKSREVIRYNTETEELKEWEFPCDYTAFLRLWNGSFFLPAKDLSKKLCRIDAETKEFLSVDELVHRMQPEEAVVSLYADEEALYVSTSYNRIYRYDGKQVEEKEVILTEEDLLYLKQQKIRYFSLDYSEVEENAFFALEDLVEKQIYGGAMSEQQGKESLGNGALIFNTIMKDEECV